MHEFLILPWSNDGNALPYDQKTQQVNEDRLSKLQGVEDLNPRETFGSADRTLQAEHLLPFFSELFPQAAIHSLAGVGHCGPEDAPEAILARIVPFLEQT